MFAELQERITMPGLRDYEDRYSSIRFERREGVLQMTLHHDGGEFIVSESALRDLGRAFRDVGQDTENRVVILTGTGERFVTQFDDGSFAATMRPDIFEFWLRTRTDGVRLLQAFLDIEVPVISAINGPVVSHSETPLLADVVLATENTVFQDATHFLNGLPPRRRRAYDLDHPARARPRPALPAHQPSAHLPGGARLRRGRRGAPTGGTAAPSVGTGHDMGELLPGDPARHSRGGSPSSGAGCCTSSYTPD
jgi:hypothetical protein